MSEKKPLKKYQVGIGPKPRNQVELYADRHQGNAVHGLDFYIGEELVAGFKNVLFWRIVPPEEDEIAVA